MLLSDPERVPDACEQDLVPLLRLLLDEVSDQGVHPVARVGNLLPHDGNGLEDALLDQDGVYGHLVLGRDLLDAELVRPYPADCGADALRDVSRLLALEL